ncbi:hypothetical protein NESM_000731400 [Novymonas esmeraldas]|uniref:Uncharacterized protein n=1 Tax=Novymonas esmeraldas TaxID=1808958 RepID=A0AAW0EU49_9TRYP
MPPKLTSKNIFDVVFDTLPADAHIDTGPASLKEELVLDAAGMASGGGGGRGARDQHGGRTTSAGSGGAVSYRRHLLPSSVWGTATAASGRGNGQPSAVDTASASRRDQRDVDILDAEELDDGAPSALGPPPAYAATTAAAPSAAAAPTTTAPPESIFQSIDDGVDGLRGDRFEARRRRRLGGGSGGVGGFEMQMDAEDDAVREATRYAALVAAAPSGEEGDTATAPNAASGTAAAAAAADTSPRGPALPAVSRSGGAQPSSTAPPTQAAMRGGAVSAAEQLALMPPGLDRVYCGSCVMYRHAKGFGFVAPDCGGPDVYFTHDGIGLSFTKLALRAYYLRHGMPVPAAVATAYRAPAATPGDGGVAATTTTTAPLVPGAAETAAVSAAAGLAQSGGGGGVLGAAAALVGTAALPDVANGVCAPPTSPDELAHAEAAASLLTPATAELLQHQVNQGIGGGVRTGDRLSFVVTRNHAGRGGGGRLLRADIIRGVPAARLAMPVEQGWFAPLFPGAVGRKGNPTHSGHAAPLSPPSPTHGSSSTDVSNTTTTTAAAAAADAAATASMLVRYTGCVRTYDAEEQRGYLRCDEADGSGNTPDVIFYGHSLLWDAVRCPPLRRQVRESMRVAYSVCGTERNGKYIATLLTAVDGAPLHDGNMLFADNVQPFFMADASAAGRRRGRGGDGGGGGGGASGGRAAMGVDGGAGPTADGVGGDRKRAKAADDDMLLLYGEDDYPFM